MNRNRKAEMGVGTLIIFIAMLLVAAVAAGVLIQTAASLQSKSLDVGRQSQEKITTDIDVVQVFANGTSDGFINGSTDAITLVARLGSGSNPVKLSDLLIKFDTDGGGQTLTPTQPEGNSTPLETTYGVTYIINGTNNQVGYLVEGDLVSVSFIVASGTDVAESESTTVRLIAKNGAVKPVAVTTPAAMVEATTYLFP